MSQSEAVARARQLREALLDYGVKKVSIELVKGRGSGGWSDTRFVGTLGHHIVSRRSQGNTPFLNLVKVGRSDLPGPLANGYGGFDEVARIICMGWANHPGAGGPITVEAGTIPRNNGRPYLFGWEFEGGIDPKDWPESFRVFMARCLAGTLAWLGRTERSHADHKDWAPTRKVDRLGYTLSVARNEIANVLNETRRPTMYLPLKRSEATLRKSDVAAIAYLLNAAYGTKLPGDGTWPTEMTNVLKTRLGEDGTFVTGKMYARLLVDVAKAQARSGALPARETVEIVRR